MGRIGLGLLLVALCVIIVLLSYFFIARNKGAYKVELISVGTEKIKVIKEVRESTGLGLADAKNLVDSAPAVIKENTTKEDAEAIKARLEEIGATVTINEK